MNKLYRSMLVTGIVAASLAGCGDDVTITEPPPPPPPPPPTVSVTVGPDGVQVSPGQNIQMTAAVTQSAGCAAAVTWSVSDATRASVSATGLVSIAAAAATGPVAVRATATCATGGATANGVATLNVVGTTVTGVTVTPSSATINAGTTNSPAQTLQASASVQGTNNPSQAVTWTSLDVTIATVNATGLVTANSNGLGGPVNIRACSNADNTKCGFLALTVIVPSPATVQIQAVTFNNGTNNVPVNLVNVFGQIEIALNVEPGSRNITRVDALIGGQVVASQAFSSAAPARAPDTPETAPTVVILSTNTAQLRENGGIFVPVVFNGNSAITANLFVSGSTTPIASNAIPVVMNNPDAVVRRRVGTRTAKLKETTSTPSAVSTNDGNTYFKGTQEVSGYDYLAFGRAVPTNVALDSDLCGGSNNLVGGSASATGGIGLAGTYTCAATEGGNSVLEDVTTTYATGATGPDGTPLVKPENSSCGGYTDINTVGSAFLVNGENRWNMFCPPVGNAPGPAYIDNILTSVSIGNVAFNDLFDQRWVNASYAFSQDLGASDGGVGLAAGYPQARQYADGSFIPASAGCGSTVVTTGNDFPETTTSSNSAASSSDWGKRICTYAQDQLGNAGSTGGSNYFGVDKVAALSRLAGTVIAPPTTPSIAPNTVASVSATANTTIYGDGAPKPVMPATDVWGLEALDTRSGFNQNAVAGFPASQTLARLAPSGATSCPTFTNPLSTVLSDNYVRSPVLVALDCGLGIGYYTYNGNVIDRAGNAATTITRNFARDHLAPPTLAAIGASTPLYTAGQPANFFLFGSDDLEIIEADLAVTYPNLPHTITKPLSAIAGAARWDAVLTNILTATTVTDPFFFGRIDVTCSGAGAPYAGCAVVDGKTAVAAQYNTIGTFTNDEMNPGNVSAIAYDVASEVSGSVGTALLTAQTSDVAEQWSGADLIAWKILPASIPTSTLMAEHMASTSIVAPFFSTALLVRGDVTPGPATVIVCGAFPAPTLTDNGLNRFWTYSIAKPAATSPCGLATGDWGAIGVKGAAGLLTQLP